MEFCRPTKDEFCRLAEQGNLIPVTRRLLADQETPLTAYRKNSTLVSGGLGVSDQQ
jgi:hypothetical protein